MGRAKTLLIGMLLVALMLVIGGDVSAGPHVHLKLKAEPEGRYLVGKPSVKIKAPVRVTLHLKRGKVRHSRIVGLGPKLVFFGGVKAKPMKLHVKGPGGHVKVGPGSVRLKGKGFKGKGGRDKIKFKF